MTKKYFQKTIIVLMFGTFCFCSKLKNDEKDVDSVINWLLSGDRIEPEDEDKEEGELLIFRDGIWLCGHCDVADKNKLLYSEINDVETNDVTDDRPIIMQVGVNVDETQCVTVTADIGSTVRRATGACGGGGVTLTVYHARHFVVQVYGL